LGKFENLKVNQQMKNWYFVSHCVNMFFFSQTFFCFFVFFCFCFLSCSYGTLEFSDSVAAVGAVVGVSAWVVRYPWVDTDNAFSSSDKTLDDVYAICNYTLKATSLDTYVRGVHRV
jgi:hypothetical protein